MHCFLAPHYDDAVYSCGGTIHQLTERGESVVIFTVMGGEPDTLPDTPIVNELHTRWAAGESPVRTRQAEDRAAAQILGAQVMHHTLPECVYRTDTGGRPFYPSESSLWHHIHPDDAALGHLLALQPADWLLAHSPKRIYAPLGAGGHVDHLIVSEWGTALAAQGHQVWFYEEYPYIEQPDAIGAALARHPMNKRLQPAHIPLTEPDISAKIDGVRAYRSQISTFWQDEATLVQRVRRALIRENQPAAEYYRIITH